MTHPEGFNSQNNPNEAATSPEITISEPESREDREVIDILDVEREAARQTGAVKAGDADALELEEKLHQSIINDQAE